MALKSVQLRSFPIRLVVFQLIYYSLRFSLKFNVLSDDSGSSHESPTCPESSQITFFFFR